jgi:hypothetical protein
MSLPCALLPDARCMDNWTRQRAAPFVTDVSWPIRHTLRDRGNYTTQPLEEAGADASSSPQCEFLRLPTGAL